MRKILTSDALAQLVYAAVIMHAYAKQNPEVRAAILLRTQKVCGWSARQLGRAAMAAELAYRREVAS